MSEYGQPPVYLGYFNFDLPEVMYYLYLPVKMGPSDIRLPPAVGKVRELVECCLSQVGQHAFKYI